MVEYHLRHWEIITITEEFSIKINLNDTDYVSTDQEVIIYPMDNITQE